MQEASPIERQYEVSEGFKLGQREFGHVQASESTRIASPTSSRISVAALQSSAWQRVPRCVCLSSLAVGLWEVLVMAFGFSRW